LIRKQSTKSNRMRLPTRILESRTKASLQTLLKNSLMAKRKVRKEKMLMQLIDQLRSFRFLVN
jgi:hypothetical protein